MKHVRPQLSARLAAQAKAMFDRLFPERQIMHRSCGAVRGLRLSPGSQALAALCAIVFAGWCVYATATTLLPAESPSVVRMASERAKYDRWLEDVRGRTAAVYETVEDMTRQFDASMRNLETRHELLRALLEYSRGSRLRLSDQRRPSPRFAVADEAMQTRAGRAAAPDGPDRIETVSLRGVLSLAEGARSETFGALLGPAEASAAPPRAAATLSDYVGRTRDSREAEVVTRVAARVEALRRANYGY